MLGVICLAIALSLGIEAMPIWMQAIMLGVCLIIMACFIYNRIKED